MCSAVKHTPKPSPRAGSCRATSKQQRRDVHYNRLRSGDRHTAIDRQDLASDHSGVIAGEIKRHARDVLRLDQAKQMRVAPVVAIENPGRDRVPALARLSTWRDLGAGIGPLLAGALLPILPQWLLYGGAAFLLAIMPTTVGSRRI